MAIIVACATSAYGQTRGVGAQAIILDDNQVPAHTITIETPQPGDPGYADWIAGGSLTWKLPVPPTAGASAGFVLPGTAAGQTLIWDMPTSGGGTGGAQGVWRPGIAGGSSAADTVAPEVVNMLGAYAGGTTYAQNDLVTSSTPNFYFYSLVNSNTGNTPETSPASWQGVRFSQLNTIHKTLTLSAPGFTSLMSLGIPGTSTSGGRIQYTVRATDGGSQIATEEGVIQYLATANSITCTVQTTDKLHLGTVNSGCTPGFFNPSSQPGVSIFDNVTFSSPAPILEHDVYFRVINVSGQMNTGAVTPIQVRLEP